MKSRKFILFLAVVLSATMLFSSISAFASTPTFKIRFWSEAGGKVDMSKLNMGYTAFNNGGSVDVDSSTYVHLTAVPDKDYTFDGWYEGTRLYSSDAVIKVQSSRDLDIVAKFKAVPKTDPAPTQPAATEESAEETVAVSVEVTIGSNVMIVDGEEVEIDAPAVIVDDRTMVPVTAILTAFGLEKEAIVWDGAANTATFTVNGHVVVITIGSDVLTVDEEEIEMPVAAQIISDRTFIALRSFEEAFGLEIEWDGDTQTVTLTGTIQ